MTQNAQRIAGLYAIADSKWNPCASLPALVEEFLKGGCRLIQLRMKDGGDVADVATDIMRLKGRWDFKFIVNDRVDVALAVGADGVHVGKDDASVAEIRREHGGRLIVGYSSHSIDEAKRAEADGADYVAFGAIFETKTKGPGHPVQGVARLRELVQSVSVPVVAIGGINRTNVREVIDAGADAVAMITALTQSGDIAREVAWYASLVNNG